MSMFMTVTETSLATLFGNRSTLGLDEVVRRVSVALHGTATRADRMRHVVFAGVVSVLPSVEYHNTCTSLSNVPASLPA